MMITAMRSRWLFFIVISGALFFNSQAGQACIRILGADNGYGSIVGRARERAVTARSASQGAARMFVDRFESDEVRTRRS